MTSEVKGHDIWIIKEIIQVNFNVDMVPKLTLDTTNPRQTTARHEKS